MFKTKARCYKPSEGSEKENCWLRHAQDLKDIPFSAHWIREEKFNDIGKAMPHRMAIDPKRLPSTTFTCEAVQNYLHDYNQLVVFDESYLPAEEGGDGKLCQQFNNVIIFREPISRILSHFQHLYNACDSKRSKDSCDKMIRQPIKKNKPKYFNVTLMTNWFDIISDNYYTRSLNDKRGFIQAEGMVDDGYGKELFNNALENLRDFDWVILLQSGNYTEDGMNRQKIIEHGLGLYDMEMHHERSRQNMTGDAAIGSDIFLHPDDYEALIKRNKFDMDLWEEAKKLHALDVSSLERLKKMQEKRVMDSDKCCGFVCKQK